MVPFQPKLTGMATPMSDEKPKSALASPNRMSASLTVGSATASFAVDETTPPPDYAIDALQASANQLRPVDPFMISGKLDPPPVNSLDDYQIVPYWQDAGGQKVPIATGNVSLQANGAFQVAATVPSLLRGDSLSGKATDQFGIDLVGAEGKATALSPAKDVLSKIGAFRVSVVKDMPGSPQDGEEVPNTPAPGLGKPDPLQVEIEPLGVFSATLGDALDLSGAEPVLDPTTIFGQLHQSELLEQSQKLVDKIVNCTILVDPLSDIKWWEWVIDPYDTIAISTLDHQLFDPTFNFEGIQSAPVNALGAAEVLEDESVSVFVFKVIVDASRVVDGNQKGYGFVNAQNVAIPTEKVFMWIPVHDFNFEIVPDEENEVFIAEFVDNPALIKLPPLPAGWKSNLQITDVDVKGFHIPPYMEGEDPQVFGTIHSFNRPQFNGTNPAISFALVEPLRIEVRLANFGYDTTVVEPIVAIQVDNTSYPVTKMELTPDSPQTFSCYQNEGQIPDTLKNFVWYTEIPNPHLVTAGDHPVVVSVSDGANTTETKSAILRYGPYPSWFDNLPIQNRTVEWGPFNVYLRGNPLSPDQAKTNVKDKVDELGEPNSKVNLGSYFECKLGPWGAWPLSQSGDMNSAALDNPAAELPFAQGGYCNDGLGAASIDAASPDTVSVSAASTDAPDLVEKVTILDTGKIRGHADATAGIDLRRADFFQHEVWQPAHALPGQGDLRRDDHL